MKLISANSRDPVTDRLLKGASVEAMRTWRRLSPSSQTKSAMSGQQSLTRNAWPQAIPPHSNLLRNDVIVSDGARAAAMASNEQPGMFRSWTHLFSWMAIFAGFDFLLYEVVKNAVKALLR